MTGRDERWRCAQQPDMALVVEPSQQEDGGVYVGLTEGGFVVGGAHLAPLDRAPVAGAVAGDEWRLVPEGDFHLARDIDDAIRRDLRAAWERNHGSRPVAVIGGSIEQRPMPAKFEPLAGYNAERARGVQHDPAYVVQMSDLQAEFDEWVRTGLRPAPNDKGWLEAGSDPSTRRNRLIAAAVAVGMVAVVAVMVLVLYAQSTAEPVEINRVPAPSPLPSPEAVNR